MIYAFEGIGTHWEIETDEPLGDDLRMAILDRVEAFDRTYSRFRSDTLVAQLTRSRNGARVEFPADSIELFALYDQLYVATRGAVDPLVGEDLELLGYDADYSLTPHADSAEARDRPRWPDDVQREGRRLTTSRAVVIDVGAAGKGYLIDQIAAMLGRAGIERAVVDGSGDLRVRGDQAVRVGLEHPTSPGQAIGVAEVGRCRQRRALCASAVNRRRWGPGLHHVIDGRTGRPTEGVLATWVLADRAAVADGVATALFFTEPDRLADRFDYSYVRMLANGQVEWSADFPGEVFTRAIGS